MFTRIESALAATALLASASTSAPAQEVNVYSYRQPELIAPLVDAFEEETGITVNVVHLNKGMVERLLAEGSRSPADLVFTVDISRLNAVVEAGLTQSVKSEVMKANVPARYRDPDGHWYGLTTRARIVYASRDRVEDGEVVTYEDLAGPKWRGRICTRSGLHAYSVALTSAVIHHHGREGARAWLEGMRTNLARPPEGNDRAQVKAIWAGECDVSLGNTYYMGKMLSNEDQRQWAESVHIVFPKFVNGGTHVNVSGVAMTASAPNRENALKLMEFLTSPGAQEIYAEANYEYPIGPGTEPAKLVRSWGEFTPDDVNLTTLAGLRAAALRLTEEVDYDAGN